jgi:hypothetical protein
MACRACSDGHRAAAAVRHRDVRCLAPLAGSHHLTGGSRSWRRRSAGPGGAARTELMPAQPNAAGNGSVMPFTVPGASAQAIPRARPPGTEITHICLLTTLRRPIS